MAVVSPLVVLRTGTEGLGMAEYAAELRRRLPDHEVRHARTPATEAALVADAPVVTGASIDEGLLDRADSLRLFACTFSGTEHLPMGALRDRGVLVTNASGIHAVGIAEQVIGYLLTFARQLDGVAGRRAGRDHRPVEFAGDTVTVVGMGAIGTAVLDRLRGFEVTTIGVRHRPAKGGPADEVLGYDRADLHDALARTGYLVLACPLTPLTRRLIGEPEFETLPPTAVVANVARGPIIDADALLAALRSGGIRGAALDVTDPEPIPPDHPLWRLDNVLLTPHMGGHTPEHWPRLAEILAENVRRLESGRDAELVNLVGPPG